MVGGGGCESNKFRRDEGGGYNGESINVVEGGEREIKLFRRVRGGGGLSL